MADVAKKQADVEKKSFIKADEGAADATNLKGDAAALVSKLKDAKGKKFDTAYTDGQVSAHPLVLDALDAKCVPAASNKNVKDFATATRKTVADHLGKAQDIVKKMSAMNDAPATTAKGKSTLANPAKAQATDLNALPGSSLTACSGTRRGIERRSGSARIERFNQSEADTRREAVTGFPVLARVAHAFDGQRLAEQIAYARDENSDAVFSIG